MAGAGFLATVFNFAFRPSLPALILEMLRLIDLFRIAPPPPNQDRTLLPAPLPALLPTGANAAMGAATAAEGAADATAAVAADAAADPDAVTMCLYPGALGS